MARQKFNISGKSPEQLSSDVAKAFEVYDGPVPPRGVYSGVLRFFKVKGPNTNGDSMLNGAVEIRMNGAKAKYNGYTLSFNQNISDQGAPYVNQMLDALSGGKESVRKAFWTKGVITDDKTGVITNIGGVLKISDSVVVSVSSKYEEYRGEPRQVVGSWLVKQAKDDAPVDDDDDDDDDAPVDDEVELETEDEDEDSDDDEDEDSDDEDSDDDEDDEDEEDEEDPQAARRTELEEMDRKGLIAIAKPLGIKALKSKTDESYIEEILAKELEASEDEPPF